MTVQPMIRPGETRYLVATRAPRYSLLFALPLLLAYEGLARLLTGDTVAGVRNGADVLLKSLFLAVGGRDGLTVFAVLLLGAGAWLVGRDLMRNGRPRVPWFGAMLLESVAYALALGAVVSSLTRMVLHPALAVVGGQGGGKMAQWGLETQIMISLGAGLYEELLFRVILVGALAWAGQRLLGWGRGTAGVVAVVLGALVFSGFHYVGAYGDPFAIESFTFRAIAGAVFSGMYLVRGFGVTAWTHALYDVFLAVV